MIDFVGIPTFLTIALRVAISDSPNRFIFEEHYFLALRGS